MENAISNGFAGSARLTHRQSKVAMTVLAAAILCIPGASAQSGSCPRTWVASNGSDSAPAQNATILSFGNNRIANDATNGSPTKIVAMQ
jgi:hypothetical protein